MSLIPIVQMEKRLLTALPKTSSSHWSEVFIFLESLL